MRVWMGLAAVLFGTILGTFGGAGAYHWVHRTASCNQGLGAVAGKLGPCGLQPQDGTYLLVGSAVGVVVCSTWTWWMLRRGHERQRSVDVRTRQP